MRAHPLPRLAALAIALRIATPATAAPADGPPAAGSVDFDRDIRPIFKDTCLSCHGPDTHKADLRLDVKAAALHGGADGPAIVPGKSAESPLIARIASQDAEFRMPPKGPALAADRVDKIRAWIDQGAVWPDASDDASLQSGHWAFRTPARPAPPAVRDSAWVRNPVDRFILARLEAEGIRPAPEADKATLLRRLSLDLTGLPPSVADLDRYLADAAPDAYETAVDRLLASPHYGEKWGRHWLDAARYADSDGFEKDKPRSIWFYRDWVIDALNRDLPYDRFIVEQLAGDLLPGASQAQVVATGYLRNSMINEEGGVAPEQFRMEAMFDRMDAIGKGILGLTIQCAQCHTHKYDPISHEEYYRLFAFLNNDDEPGRVVYTPGEASRVAEVHRQIGEIERQLRDSAPDWRARMDRWEDDRAKAAAPTWVAVQASFNDLSNGGQKYEMLKDGSFRACGYAPTKHTGFFTVKSPLETVTAFRLELLNDPNLPAYGPGRSFKGTCALTEFKVEAAPAAEPGKKSKVKLAAATSDYDQPEAPLEPNFDDKSGKARTSGPVALAIDGKDETAWGIDAGPGRRNQPREAVFVAEAPVTNPGGTELTIALAQNHGGWNSDDLMTNNLGRFRISVTDAPAASADAVPKAVREVLAVPRDRRTPAQVEAVFGHWRTTVPEWKGHNDRIEAIWKGHPAGSTTLVLSARDEPRTTSILKRGDFLKPGRAVTPGVPAFLNPLPADAPPTRLTLARWLVDPKAPTTGRAFVNRAWQAYFGTGLLASAEDLGTQSEPPSHPELLDWLAREFVDGGWGVKALHRLVVTSATYRQSSTFRPELEARDPLNRLLARGARLRVDGEGVRDIALAASGLLNPQVGGPSVFAPAPAFLFQPPTSYAPFPWKEETGAGRYRRALYTFRRRSTPYPALTAFDAPNGDTSCVRRGRSNTPLQALTTLNESVFVDCARALAAATLRDGGPTDSDRLSFAFRRVLGRVPTDDERAALVAVMEKQARRIAEGWINPRELATGKDALPDLPPGATPTQLAVLTVVSRVLLNLDEAITKE